MLIDLLIIVVGIAGILFLAEVVIRNAVELASYFRLSGSFIGMTVLSIGTSVPEIMSHIVGSLEIVRHPESMNTISGLLVGTNIGSDIFQQNFILPVVALVGTVIVVRAQLHDVMAGLLGAAVLAWLFCLDGQISRLDGGVLLLAYGGYLFYLLKRDSLLGASIREESASGRTALLSAVIIIISFAIMAVVTEYVVVTSTELVAILPISASFFGVVFLGVATSLPELTTALVSMHKGKKDISVGILLGSNITNPLFGIGIGAIISTYTVPDVTVVYDLPVNVITAVLLYIFLLRSETLTKKEATVLLLSFFVYIYARWLWFPADFPSIL